MLCSRTRHDDIIRVELYHGASCVIVDVMWWLCVVLSYACHMSRGVVWWLGRSLSSALWRTRDTIKRRCVDSFMAFVTIYSTHHVRGGQNSVFICAIYVCSRERTAWKTNVFNYRLKCELFMRPELCHCTATPDARQRTRRTTALQTRVPHTTPPPPIARVLQPQNIKVQVAHFARARASRTDTLGGLLSAALPGSPCRRTKRGEGEAQLFVRIN